MQTNKTDVRSWLWVLALVCVLKAWPADAQELRWTTGQGYTTATALDTAVEMQINGLVARVAVRQEFQNDGNEWTEGIYVFPLPDRAAVDRMRLHIGDRYIEGEIREKEQAEREYEQAKREGRKASLVRQERANLFTTQVANVAPGELVVVEIEYLEDLRFEDGQFSIRLPMTLAPRYSNEDVDDSAAITPVQVMASRRHRITLEAHINAGMPLALVASRYHPVSVRENGGRYHVELAIPNTPMDHDFELIWRPVPSAEPRAMAFTETIDGEPYHLLMVMPPDQRDTALARVPREMLFVVDTSGSMHGVSMTQAKKAVRLAIESLRPGDLFNVIEFDSYTSALYPYSMPANSVNVGQAVGFVQALQADGGTEMRPALKLAFESPARDSHLRQIVFITDGSVGYEDEMFSMIERKLGDARLFTVGIGSAPNSLFMRKAAEAGRGSYTFISVLHEVNEKMSALFRKLENPQVTDIELAWPSGVQVDAYPSVVPDLYLGQPITVRTRALGGFRPGDALYVSGNSVAGAWRAGVPLDASASAKGVAALWARARIGELLDAERRGGDTSLLRADIVATALTHRLVSKYTSLVAVDKTPVRPAGEPLASERVPNLMPYGQGALMGFPATATSAPALRIMGAGWLLAALLLLVMIRTSRPRAQRY
ncbi:MAG: marine proteobacterial sortase target protein [Gammaproteobacteria bacterium]|nr:marine proteobacterial sortase target protein [Gammaproteobacteria bacterium]MBT8093282.1 marine proteobacterial sortase target protein [Gammaproteobacteria bacterium]